MCLGHWNKRNRISAGDTNCKPECFKWSPFRRETYWEFSLVMKRQWDVWANRSWLSMIWVNKENLSSTEAFQTVCPHAPTHRSCISKRGCAQLRKPLLETHHTPSCTHQVLGGEGRHHKLQAGIIFGLSQFSFLFLHLVSVLKRANKAGLRLLFLERPPCVSTVGPWLMSGNLDLGKVPPFLALVRMAHCA